MLVSCRFRRPLSCGLILILGIQVTGCQTWRDIPFSAELPEHVRVTARASGFADCPSDAQRFEVYAPEFVRDTLFGRTVPLPRAELVADSAIGYQPMLPIEQICGLEERRFNAFWTGLGLLTVAFVVWCTIQTEDLCIGY